MKFTRSNTPGRLYESGGGRRRTGQIGNGRGPDKGHEYGLCEVCNGRFELKRGIKIHQSKTKCGKILMERRAQTQSCCSVDTQKSGGQPDPGKTPQCEGKASVIEEVSQETRNDRGDEGEGAGEKLGSESAEDYREIVDTQQSQIEGVGQREGIESAEDYREIEDTQQSQTAEVKPQKPASKGRGKQLLVTQWFRRTGATVMTGEKSITTEKPPDSPISTQWFCRTGATVMTGEKSITTEKQPDSPVSTTGVMQRGQESSFSEENTAQENHNPVSRSGEIFVLNTEARNKFKAATAGKDTDVVVNHGVQVTVEDLKTTPVGEWFGQTIVDAYYNILEQRSSCIPELPAVKAVSTYFYRKLVEPRRSNESALELWGGDMLSRDIIFFPTLWDLHYNLTVWFVGSGEVQFWDSLPYSRRTSQVPVRIVEFIRSYCRRRNIQREIRLKRCDGPLQNNSNDCGPYICKFAEMIARRGRVEVQQQEMEYIRSKIVSDILLGRIQEECLRGQLKEIERSAGEVGKMKKQFTEVKAVEKRPRRQRVHKEKVLAGVVEEKGAPAVEKRPGRQRVPKKEKVHAGEVEEKGATAEVKQGAKKQGNSSVKDPVRERVLWPKANSEEWQKLDETLGPMLQNLGGTAQQRVENFPDIIYHFSLERFGGVVPRRKKGQSSRGTSRRQGKCIQLRAELKNLKKAHFEAADDEKSAVEELQIQTRRELKMLRKAEAVRKNRKKTKEMREKFTKEPFKVAKEIMSDPVKGELKSTKEEVERFLKEAHSDARRDEEMEECEGLYEFPEPKVPFSMKEPTLGEIREIIKKARAASAPGPNGVPYKVYKYCPQILRVLWSNLRGIWKAGTIPKTWRKAEGCLLPKEDGAQEIDKFRTVSFLNCEGKVFFKHMSKGITQYAVANDYIDQSIQKAGIPGISGCLENTSLISQMILEAKEKQKSLVSVWLDIAKAFLSIPHQVVMETLRRIRVPEEILKMVESYYNGVYVRFSTEQFVTEWLRLEKGIVTGCTISVILFALGMTWMVKSVERETKGPVMETGVRQTNARLYMDDINTTTETVPQTRCLMAELGRYLGWARMDVKASKSRVLIIRKGKVERQPVEIQGEAITSILDKPIKYLGKWFNHKLTDRDQVEEARGLVEKYLQRIETSHLPGKFKVWIMQNVMMPRIMWPLSIYDYTVTTVEKIQRMITAKIKKWLGFPRSLSEAVLYSSSSKLQLPCSSLVEEVKVTKARNKVTLEQSRDANIRGAGVEYRTGRKWKVAEDVEKAKSQLRLQEIAGIANIGREGVGLNKRVYYSKASKWERRKLITQKVRENEEEQRRVRVVGMWKQGRWMKWPVEVRKITSQELWKMSEASIKFLVKSTYDLLPTPANKNTWFNTEEKCVLCGGNATLNHILSSCKQALAQGRYLWRHNNVLRELAKVMEPTRLQANQKKKTQRTWINFTKGGVKPTGQALQVSSYLDNARDWEMMVDLKNSPEDEKYQFPKFIATTRKRPDMIIYSKATRCLGMVELTVPFEDRMEVANELKRSSYEELKTACEANGWRVSLWPVEVGARGFISPSLHQALKSFGITGRKRRDCIKAMSSEAERSSRILWSMHKVPSWGWSKAS